MKQNLNNSTSQVASHPGEASNTLLSELSLLYIICYENVKSENLLNAKCGDMQDDDINLSLTLQYSAIVHKVLPTDIINSSK